MRKFILASFSLCLLTSAADAQLFRRFRREPVPVVEQAPIPAAVSDNGYKTQWKNVEPVEPVVVQQADAGRPGKGKIIGFIKRILGR